MNEKRKAINPLQAALQTVSELTAEEAQKIENAILEHRLDILAFLSTDQNSQEPH